jgi:hypothetical protein
MMTALVLTSVLLLATPAPTAPTQDPAADKAAVHQAALDYVEALYEADPSKIERSVHPNLTKRGFMRGANGQFGPMATMTYPQLVELTSSWNKAGTRDTSIKKVEVLDVADQTAAAKITAQWGIDYMQLAKFDGRWKIVNIVWQTPPANR